MKFQATVFPRLEHVHSINFRGIF